MTDRDSVVTALAGGWFGSGLSPHARSQLAYCATLRPYPAGAVILREGDETDPFGVVTAGRVALRLLIPERGEATIMTVEPGDVVGWSALVPPRRSTSTAVALEPTTLLAFDVGELRRALLDNAELAATVYPRLLEAVARRLGATRHQLLDLYAQEAEPVPW